MSVDWVQQWELFAENFYDGKAHIDLSRFGGKKELLLLSGPGFGDLSHPTTYLMLQMMKGKIQGRTVVDVGIGSGILALAALFLGAPHAIGVDIDLSALSHAKKNSQLNGLEKKLTLSKYIPSNPPKPNLFLMNMIFQDQQSVNPGRFKTNCLVVSGILEEQKECYLKQMEEWGWIPREERLLGGWIGWIFERK